MQSSMMLARLKGRGTRQMQALLATGLHQQQQMMMAQWAATSLMMMRGSSTALA